MKSLKCANWLFAMIILCAVSLGSCSTPKDIAYFQDAEAIRGMALQSEQLFRLRPQDKINIVVNSADPMLVQQFNLVSRTTNSLTLGASVSPLTSSGGNTTNGQTVAYTVDDQGDINFPVLGKVSVLGKTRKEVAEYIQDRLIARDLVKDPIVTVEYVNLGVDVLGEVNKPGHIDILKDHFTIIDAISRAGDLTINGRRDYVMVSREVDGEDQTFIIDLTNRQDMLTSPAYYLQQNDVVYVSPNNKRMREAKSAGNTFNQPTIWISLASLLTTITAIILR